MKPLIVAWPARIGPLATASAKPIRISERATSSGGEIRRMNGTRAAEIAPRMLGQELVGFRCVNAFQSNRHISNRDRAAVHNLSFRPGQLNWPAFDPPEPRLLTPRP